MAFFDDTGLGLSKVGQGLERGAAVYEGRGPQFDLAQQNIAESQQNVHAKKMDNLKTSLRLLEDVAWSTSEDPKLIEPILRQVQQAAKDVGQPISENLIQHYLNNPAALGNAFNDELDQYATLQEKRQLKQLQIGANRDKPGAIKQVTEMRDGIAMRAVTKEMERLMTEHGFPKEQALEQTIRTKFNYLLSKPERFKQVKAGAESYGETIRSSRASNAFNLLMDQSQNDPEVKKSTAEQLRRLADFSDEQLTQLRDAGFINAKSKALMKKEQESEVESSSSKAADLRLDKNIAAANDRQDKAIAASNARQDKHIAAITEGLGPAAAARVRKEIEQNSPLDVRATRWVHPDTLKPASPDMTPTEAREAGYAVVTSQLSQAVPSARTALVALDKYEELSKKLLPSIKGKNTAEALAAVQTNRVKLAVKDKAGDADVKDFIALGSTVPTQVKAFGDTGNIAIKESEFALKALPGPEDSLESALQKIKSRRELLKIVVKNSLSSTKSETTTPNGGWSIRPK